jgi:glycosyltransferase involved in cell wall biosynthesis
MEARRERRGGRVRISVSTSAVLGLWEEDVPWLTPFVVPLATTREREPIAPELARAELHLPRPGRIALFFGMHPGKDPAVVFRAFRELLDWQLVVAGNGAAHAYRAWAEVDRHPWRAAPPVLIDGYVDERTRGLVHAAADLVVLSFLPSWLGIDSAGLVDALDRGVPVVCSDRCPAAELVRAHGLGVVFTPSDADSLADAVRSAPEHPDPRGLQRVRAELSARRAAELLLSASSA